LNSRQSVGSALRSIVCTAAAGVQLDAIGNIGGQRDSGHYFVIAALFSFLAYTWLALVLLAISPNVLELWEALVMLLLFAPMIIVTCALPPYPPLWVSVRLRAQARSLFRQHLARAWMIGT
jgi:hypothetical protein